jgi:hypothetical protein
LESGEVRPIRLVDTHISINVVFNEMTIDKLAFRKVKRYLIAKAIQSIRPSTLLYLGIS